MTLTNGAPENLSIFSHWSLRTKPLATIGAIIEIFITIMASVLMTEGANKRVDRNMAALTESTASVHEMIAGIHSVAEITLSKKDAGRKLALIAQEGSAEINRTNEIIEGVLNDVDDILKIIHIISDISEKMSVLSINAAIESAHAGQVGKGFAVIAQEINKLSVSAAKNIQDVSDIVKRSARNISAASARGNETKMVFLKIEDEIASVVQALDEIITGTQEMSTGGEQILQAMTEVTSSQQEIMQGSTDMRESLAVVLGANEEVGAHSSEIVNHVDNIQQSLGTISEMARGTEKATNILSADVELLSAEVSRFIVPDAN